jgi:hypothetical protein
MEIRNRSTGELTTVSQFKASLPNTSFPKQITTDVLDSFGYDALLQGPQATVTAPYETSFRDGVEEIAGQWFTKYSVGPVFVEYTDEDDVVRTVEEQLEQYKAGIDAKAAEGVRSSRNSRLAECDWTQLSDQPFSAAEQAAWSEYRQGLRDVPESEGFPHDVTWPESPDA